MVRAAVPFELLVGDGADEGLEGAAFAMGLPRARADALDEAGHRRVGFAQMGNGLVNHCSSRNLASAEV